MLYFDNCLDFIAQLSLLLEILDNMCIAVICFPVCEVINFEINLRFFNKLFSFIPINIRTKIYILRTKRDFNMKEK